MRQARPRLSSRSRAAGAPEHPGLRRQFSLAACVPSAGTLPSRARGNLRFADVRLVIGTRPELSRWPRSRMRWPPAAAGRRWSSPASIRSSARGVRLGGYLASPRLPRRARPARPCPQGHCGAAPAAARSARPAGRPGRHVERARRGARRLPRQAPVAHVEAGPRTHDPALPWPEEDYRVAIDARADLLFAPTETAAANLRSEQVPRRGPCDRQHRHRCFAGGRAKLPPPALSDRRHAAPAGHLPPSRELGRGPGSIAAALTEIAADGAAQIDFVLHPNPHVASTMRALLGRTARIALIEPAATANWSHGSATATSCSAIPAASRKKRRRLARRCWSCATRPSGPKAIASRQHARLVGTSTERSSPRPVGCSPIRRANARWRVARFPFGDGRAGPRIAAVIQRGCWNVPTRSSIRCAEQAPACSSLPQRNDKLPVGFAGGVQFSGSGKQDL